MTSPSTSASAGALVSGVLVLVGFWAAGEVLVRLAGVPVPGSVVGMVGLAVAIRRGWLGVGRVRPVADGLLANLALLFVPPGVGLMAFFGLIGREWLPVVLGNVVGVVAVLVVVGVVAQALEGRARAGADA